MLTFFGFSIHTEQMRDLVSKIRQLKIELEDNSKQQRALKEQLCEKDDHEG